MESTLTVTNDPDYSHATEPTASSVQQTSSADNLGFHTTPPADAAPVDQKLMDFLSSEASGSTYETTKKPDNKSFHSFQLAGTAIAVIFLMALLLISYQRLFRKRLSPVTTPKKAKIQ